MNKNIDLIHTTDDGYNSIGYTKIRDLLLANGVSFISIVPLKNKSGFSGSIDKLNIENIHIVKRTISEIILDTTPVNCIRWAIAKGYIPNLIVVGINNGLNLQKDLFISGTLMTACYSANKGYKSLAISQENIELDSNTDAIIKNIQMLITCQDVECYSLNIPYSSEPHNKFIQVYTHKNEEEYIKECKCTLRKLNYLMI